MDSSTSSASSMSSSFSCFFLLVLLIIFPYLIPHESTRNYVEKLRGGVDLTETLTSSDFSTSSD
jgi:hypothetical protein